MSNIKNEKLGPHLDEVSSALRCSWAQPQPVLNNISAIREIAPLVSRLRAAAHVAVSGPMLCYGQTNYTVMWDANSFNGHDVAFESSELIADILELWLLTANKELISALENRSALRRSRHYEQNDRPQPVSSERFIRDPIKDLVTNQGNVALVTGSTELYQFRFDPRTGRLLAISVPIGSGFNDFCNNVESKIKLFNIDLSELCSPALISNPYAGSMKTLLWASIADLKVLLREDSECVKRFFNEKAAG